MTLPPTSKPKLSKSDASVTPLCFWLITLAEKYKLLLGEGGLGVKAGSVFRRRRGAGRQHLSERLERIEDADGELETAEVTRRVIHLRQPVGVDVAEANRSERGVGRRRVIAVARAHAGQRHVIQDRIGAEQTDVAAEQELAHVLVAESHEDLPHVDARAAERRIRLARALLQVRAAVVGTDPGIEAEGHGEVVAVLCRRRTQGQCGGQQAVADGRGAVFARAAAARQSPRDRRGRFRSHNSSRCSGHSRCRWP